MRAVAYIRVSTGSEEQKTSLESQEQYFRERIEKRGDVLVNIYSDAAKSGTKSYNRTQLNRMMAAARRHEFDKVYAKDVSRLFRNMSDFIDFSRELDDLGIVLHLSDMGEAGKDVDPFTVQLMALLAEDESRKISRRVRFGKVQTFKRGIVPSHVFGYRKIDKYTLEIDEQQAHYVKRIFEMYIFERKSMKMIADYLTSMRVSKSRNNKDGTPNYTWSIRAVAFILKNPLYTGKIINGKQEVKDLYTSRRVDLPEEDWYVVERPELRIIPDDWIGKANAIAKDKEVAYLTEGRRNSTKHIFSNLIVCGCGSTFRRYAKKLASGEQRARWVCNRRAKGKESRESCGVGFVKIYEQDLLDKILEILSSLVKDKRKFVSKIKTRCKEIIKAKEAEISTIDMDDLKQKLNTLNSKRENTLELAVNDIISMKEAKARVEILDKEIEEINIAISHTKTSDTVLQDIEKELEVFYTSIQEGLSSVEITNADLKMIISKIVVHSKDNIEIYFNIDALDLLSEDGIKLSISV